MSKSAYFAFAAFFVIDAILTFLEGHRWGVALDIGFAVYFLHYGLKKE